MEIKETQIANNPIKNKFNNQFILNHNTNQKMSYL